MSGFAHPDLCKPGIQAWYRCSLCARPYSEHENGKCPHSHGKWDFKPLPRLQPHRVNADFTGIHAMEDAERLSNQGGVTPSNDGVISVEGAAPSAGGNIAELPIAIALEKTAERISDVVSGPTTPPPAANDQYQPSAIGLSGFAQTGKTTVANYIESQYGYRRQHIAEPLRAMLRTLLERYRYTDEVIDRYLTGDLKEAVIPELGVTSRHAQITIGTEWGRELINQDIWADLWALEASWAEGRKAMNDSVRFPNEENAIRHELGGFTILVRRAGTKPVAFKWGVVGEKLYDWFGLMIGVHDSERVDRLNPDYVIDNDGTLDELHRKIDHIMDEELVRSCSA